jgi:uncharacterized phage protein (TIGR01671 family)
MIEIKFRAWSAESTDENDNPIFEMIEADSLAISNYDLLCEQLKDTENFKLMQFTCMLDKNGVEIYLGDIVKTKKRVGVVKFSNGGYNIDGWALSFYSEHHEVIGNIYQNSNLIK